VLTVYMTAYWCNIVM